MNRTNDKSKVEEPERLHPMGTRLSEKEYIDLEALRNIYGGVSFPKALRMAIGDALAYHIGTNKEQPPSNNNQKLPNRISALEKEKKPKPAKHSRRKRVVWFTRKP